MHLDDRYGTKGKCITFVEEKGLPVAKNVSVSFKFSHKIILTKEIFFDDNIPLFIFFYESISPEAIGRMTDNAS